MSEIVNVDIIITPEVYNFDIAIQGIQGPAGSGGGSSAVTSVNGHTGDIILAKSDISLGNVDNTADSAKPISALQQAALNLKQDASSAFSGDYNSLSNKPSIPAAQVNSDWSSASGVSQILNKPTIPTTTSQLTNNSGFLTSAPVTSVASKTGAVTLVKGDVGLGSVDNTADASKPVSTLQASADSAVQAFAIQRANHTGTQTADTIIDGTTNKAYTATEKTKLSGIATGATANSSDATLLSRANHTGTQAAGTITGLATVATTGAYADLSGRPTLGTASAINVSVGTTAPSSPLTNDLWVDTN